MFVVLNHQIQVIMSSERAEALLALPHCVHSLWSEQTWGGCPFDYVEE